MAHVPTILRRPDDLGKDIKIDGVSNHLVLLRLDVCHPRHLSLIFGEFMRGKRPFIIFPAAGASPSSLRV